MDGWIVCVFICICIVNEGGWLCSFEVRKRVRVRVSESERSEEVVGMYWKM